jgi:ATP-binding cassette, subfamily A (ABC1), member 3
MALYSTLTAFVMIVFFSYGADASRIFISTDEATVAVFLLVFLYGSAAIPLSYLYSFAFDNYSTAQISIMTVNFFTGFVAVMAYYIMVSIPSTKETGETLVWVFRMFPPYNIGEGEDICMSVYLFGYILCI